MHADPRLIDSLNDILAAEIAGIHQYVLHGKMCDHWGYECLAEVARKEAVEEMKHAEELIERLLFLGSMPALQRLPAVQIGRTPLEQLQSDRSVEVAAVERLNRAIALAAEVGDHGTKQLLEKLLRSEEEHLEWLEAQLELVKQIGEQNYLAQQIRAR